MKKTNLLSWTLALVGVLFLFSACDDDKEGSLVPSQVVLNLSFTDTDFEEGTIGGKVTWDLPDDESGISSYIIYKSNERNETGTSFATVKPGVTEYTIENGTEYFKYLNVVASNEFGESHNMASIMVYDNTSPVVTGVSFEDADIRFENIGGLLTWNLIENEEVNVSNYVIYQSTNVIQKGEQIAKVSASEKSYQIAEGTAYKPYLHVVVEVAGVESDDFTSVYVLDEFEKQQYGYYILNRGNWNSNDAALAYMDLLTGNLQPDIYKSMNGMPLGDSAEQILVYGSKMYVTVTTSNRLLVLDLNGKQLAEHNPIINGSTAQPRRLIEHDGYVYVSYLYGHSVAKLDTLDLQIKGVTTVGQFPEEIAVSGEKLYVANSGYGSDNTISVVDLKSFKEEKKIEVLSNPTIIKADSRGDLLVISMQDYSEYNPNTLQKIDVKTGNIQVFGKATSIALHNDEVYTIYAQWGDTGIDQIDYVKYDAQTGMVLDNNFIKDGTNIKQPTSLNVNPYTGQIYITDYNSQSSSNLYVYSREGKLLESIDTKGNNAIQVLFRAVAK